MKWRDSKYIALSQEGVLLDIIRVFWKWVKKKKKRKKMIIFDVT